ncbi:MAG: DNA polymerase III subunit gamma/tau [Planctomycetota bacterium]
MSDASSSDETDSGYVVVARRYRPKDFDQLVGQDHVAQALRGAIETSRVGHAYLFTGARGVGKTSTARIFAKALNDPGGPTTNPDSGNDIAQAIDAGEDVDVIEIDGASNRGIDEIRSLRSNVGVRPSRSRYKIYIIDEVHMLTGAAFNALLKTLEEPPEHVKFIFCTTDPEKIPITVLSRCQRFDFAPVESHKIVDRLREIVTAEDGTAEDKALELLARRAAGSMRDSQSLLEQVLSFSDGHLTVNTVHTMLGTADDQRLHALATAMSQRDAAAALEQVDEAVAAGIDAGRLAEQMLGYFRDLMAVGVGCDPSLMRYAATSMHDSLHELNQHWGLQTVLAIVGMIDQTLVRIRTSVHARVLLESTVIQICHLPNLQTLSDLTHAATTTASAAGEKKNATVTRRNPDVPTTETHQSNPADSSVSSVSATRLDSAETIPSSHVGRHDPTVGHAAAQTGSVATGPSASAGTSAAVTRAVSTASHPAVDRRPITEAIFREAWPQVLSEVDPMIATLVKASKQARVVDNGHVRIDFPSTASLAMSRCGKPEYQEELVRTIARVTGYRATVTMDLDRSEPAIPKRSAPRQKPKNRMQRMQEIESNPLIRSCVELLGGEIVRIDSPRD